MPCVPTATVTNIASSLSIEIHSTIEYHDEWDIKIITLEPVDASIETRLGTRLKQIETIFMTELKRRDEMIDELFAENDILFERNRKLRKSLERAVDEIANLNDKFNKKDESAESDSSDEESEWSDKNGCNRAANNGWLELLKFLRETGHPWSVYTYILAAKNGHIDVVKYLHENGCPRPRSSIAINIAARNGHLDVVKYLYEHGYYWNATTCAMVIKNNHLDIVKYLHDSGCPCKNKMSST